jgi:hypothetical protein
MHESGESAADAAALGTAFDSDARCLDCNYTLRGLRGLRCPECGREFDPDDPRTVNLGPRSRIVRPLMGPLPAWIRSMVVWGCCMIVWGSALLPGGLMLELLGWFLIALVTCYSLIRRLLRGQLRFIHRLGRLQTPDSERYRRWQLLIIFVATTSPVLSLPLRMNVLIERPFLNHLAHCAYDEEPMLFPPSPPRFAGLFIFIKVAPGHDGVVMEVPGGGELFWYARDTEQVQGPYPNTWHARTHVGGRWWTYR